jgi:hypothetical protein
MRQFCQFLLASLLLLPSLALAQESALQPTPSTESPSDAANPFVPDAADEGNQERGSLDSRFADEYFDSSAWNFPQKRAPNMIGDYFGGYAAGGRGSFVLDRLTVVANDLDSPAVLPPAGSTLTITEPGPVGIFSSSLTNVQQLQQLLRAGSPVPAQTLAGTIADNGTLTNDTNDITNPDVTRIDGTTVGHRAAGRTSGQL